MNSLATPSGASVLKAPAAKSDSMLHPPQSLVALGAGFFSALTARRLRSRGAAIKSQARAAATLFRAIAGTAYGRAHGVESGMDARAWRER
ncbi:MAG: hypothetical protein RLZZ50_255, partial [Verrucomicrobiota bacterium]